MAGHDLTPVKDDDLGRAQKHSDAAADEPDRNRVMRLTHRDPGVVIDARCRAIESLTAVACVSGPM